jgi:predicted dehydrogenase
MDSISVGIIGCGYWGPNLIRNFMSCHLTEVVAVCDPNLARLESIGTSYPSLKRVGSIDELLGLRLDAVAIATPVSTHYPLAKRCLDEGLHVLVEKPLASSESEAIALNELAAQRRRVLMVDHTYLFSNAVRRIKEIVDSGDLGDLYYVDSVRINLGLFQHDINVVWDLAPHDLSIVDYVLGRVPRSISACGCSHANPNLEDMAYINVDYDDRLLANFHVNWLSPVKIRQMIFGGARKSLIFNELDPNEPIKIYDRGIELGGDPDERRKYMVNYRSGDVWSPHIERAEPLQSAVRHFAECIREGKTPLSDGALGLRVVRLLETATRSLRAQGGRVVLSHGSYGAVTGGINDSRASGSSQLRPDRPKRPAGQERRPARVR